MARLTHQLLNATAQAAVTDAVGQACVLRIGAVTAIDVPSKTLTCTVAGVTLRKVPYMKSYTPTVADVVWLLHQNSTVVAIGAF